VDPPGIVALHPSVWDECGNSIFYVSGYGFSAINTTSFKAIVGSILVPLFVLNSTTALGVTVALTRGTHSTTFSAFFSGLSFESRFSINVNGSCIPDISSAAYTLPFNTSALVVPFGRWSEIWRSAQCLWSWEYGGELATKISNVDIQGCSSPKLQHSATLSIVFTQGDASFSLSRYLLNIIEERVQAMHPVAFQQSPQITFTIHGIFPSPPYNVTVGGAAVRCEHVSSSSLRVHSSNLKIGTLEVRAFSSRGLVHSDQVLNMSVHPRLIILYTIPDTLTNRWMQDVVVYGSGFSYCNSIVGLCRCFFSQRLQKGDIKYLNDSAVICSLRLDGLSEGNLSLSVVDQFGTGSSADIVFTPVCVTNFSVVFTSNSTVAIYLSLSRPYQMMTCVLGAVAGQISSSAVNSSVFCKVSIPPGIYSLALISFHGATIEKCDGQDIVIITGPGVFIDSSLVSNSSLVLNGGHFSTNAPAHCEGHLGTAAAIVSSSSKAVCMFSQPINIDNWSMFLVQFGYSVMIPRPSLIRNSSASNLIKNPLRVTSVTPSSLSFRIPTQIFLSSASDTNLSLLNPLHYHCIWNEAVTAVSFSHSFVSCLSPVIDQCRDTKLQLVYSGVFSLDAIVVHQFIIGCEPLIQVSSIVPSAIDCSSSFAILTLFGTNFKPETVIKCGDSSFEVSNVQNATQATFIFYTRAKFETDGVIFISASNNAVEWSHPFPLYCVAVPLIERILPGTPSVPGPVGITVFGKTFSPGVPVFCSSNDQVYQSHVVNFGSTVCWFSFLNPGNFSLKVSFDGSTWSEAPVPVEITPIGTLWLNPSIGNVQGGTRILIGGLAARWIGRVLVRFGVSEDALVLANEASGIWILSPPSIPGVKRVSVSIDHGRSFLFSNLVFEYRPALVVTSLVPTSAVVRGGTPVTIFGLHFVADSLFCRFDGRNMLTAHVTSSTHAECIAPQSRPGVVSFEVSHNAFEWERMTFLIEPDIVLHLVSPQSGSCGEDATVTVIGSGFQQSQSLSCKFGVSDIVSARYLSGTRIICSVPAGLYGNVSLQVSNNFHDWSRQSVVYSSTGSHRGLLVFPSVGYVNGGDSVVVKILGSGFEFWESLNDLSCTFGESTSLGLALNRDEVLCSTPRFNEVGLVDVSLVNSSTKHAFGGKAFLFVDSRETFVVQPTLLIAGSLTEVTIFSGSSSFAQTVTSAFCSVDMQRDLWPLSVQGKYATCRVMITSTGSCLFGKFCFGDF
jgi:hypothetical protein